MAKKPKQYYRDNAKKHREINKKLRELYRSIESHPGETFTEFKKRKKSLGW